MFSKYFFISCVMAFQPLIMELDANQFFKQIRQSLVVPPANVLLLLAIFQNTLF